MSVPEITVDDYHRDELGAAGRELPSLSSSIARTLIRFSPAHAYAEHPRLGATRVHKASDSFDLGDAVHGILLEGMDRIVEVDAPDWKKKAAQEERAAAREAGRIPMLVSQADRCRQMVAAVRERLAEFDVSPALLDPAGRPEVPVVWDEDGVQCRALLDWLHPLEAATVDDVKTTSGSGSPEEWSRRGFYSFGYDVQAAFHSRGARALVGRDVEFRFIVIEAEPPFEMSVFTPGPDVMAVANARVDYAIRTWRECLATGRWPGYPRRLATIELPGWEEQRWIEREERDG